MRLLPLAIIVYLFTGCASIKPPPGGEEDKTPPSIDTTYPFNNALNVPVTIKPHINFEQNVDRASFMQSVTLTPYMGGVIKFDWSGYDEVELELPESLRDSTTYILTIGRDLKTRRSGVLTSPIQIIFSTGSSLDSGVISGKIYPAFQASGDENFSALFVFAYDITRRSADTLNLTTSRPDYITQPDSKGNFELKALKIGHRYRVLAVGDEFRNRLYDHAIDSYGIPTGDVDLLENNFPTLSIRMVPKIDTTKPRIEDIEVRDAYHFRVRFNEAVDSSSVQEYNFELYREGEVSPMTLAAAYKEDAEKKPSIVTLVPFDSLQVGSEYTVHALNTMIRDVNGNLMSPDHAPFRFSVPSTQDTFSPPRFIRYSVADSARNVSVLGNIKVLLSDAANSLFLDSAFSLYDSTGRPVPIELRYGDDSRVTVRSRDTLMQNAWYRLETSGELIMSPISAYYDKIRDTTYILRFHTEDLRDAGTVSGTVSFADSIYNPATHRVVIQLINVESNTRMRKVLSEGRSTYSFDRVPAGRYKVRGWLTEMENNMWLGGKVHPFSTSMPTGEYQELIDVRSRWTVEDVNFDLK